MSTATVAVISGLLSGRIVATATGLIELVRVRERGHGQLVGAGCALLVAGEQLIAELANQPRPSRFGNAVVTLVERFLPEMDYLGGHANQRLFHPGLPAARDRYWEAVATLLLIGDRRIIAALVDTGDALEKAVDDPVACAAGIRQAQADIARVVNPLGPRSWWRPGIGVRLSWLTLRRRARAVMSEGKKGAGSPRARRLQMTPPREAMPRRAVLWLRRRRLRWRLARGRGCRRSAPPRVLPGRWPPSRLRPGAARRAGSA